MSKENNKFELKSGYEWSQDTNIQVVNCDGWFSEKEFNEEKISKWEFFNRASNSVLVLPSNISRREAAKLRSLLFKRDGK